MNTEEMTVQELQALRKLNDVGQSNIFILDVREPDEFAACNIQGYLIPLKELPDRLNEIPMHGTVVVHCKGGGRSKKAVDFLGQNGFKNVVNLKGGIKAWMEEIGVMGEV